MARRQWTLLLVADNASEVRQLRVPRELVRVVIAAGLLVLSVLISLALGFLVQEHDRLRAERLARKNELLEAEVQRMERGVGELRQALEGLSRQDEHYRLLAGLEPLDEEVRQAGVGGPGTETLGSSRLWRADPTAGARTFALGSELNAMLRRARLLAASWREAADTLAHKQERLRATPSILPTAGYVTSLFDYRRMHPLLDRPRFHQGIDISAPRGTPILAAARGVVRFAGRHREYGLMIELKHGHGYVTRYAHASRLLARPGQVVERGVKIAEVGSTGLAIGPHLHYEVLVNGRPTDPRTFIFDAEVIRD